MSACFPTCFFTVFHEDHPEMKSGTCTVQPDFGFYIIFIYMTELPLVFGFGFALWLKAMDAIN